jgi:hypothetical protein
MRKILFITGILISVTIMTACGNKEVFNYIKNTKEECVKILFTCPQHQEVFSNENGCGCLQNGKNGSSEVGLINDLMSNYLKQKIMEAPEGTVFAEYIILDATETGSDVNYQIWAEIRDYSKVVNANNKGSELKINKNFEGPILVNMTQTGLNFIINSSESLDATDKASLEKNLSKKSLDWIYGDKENKEKIIKKMIDSLENSAKTALGI